MDDSKSKPAVKLDHDIQEKESQLTALKAEIKSRQRLLAQLNESKAGDSTLAEKVKRLENEVFIRDRQIDALNERVISLDSKLREKGEDRKSQENDEVISKLHSEISTLQQFRLESDLKSQELQSKITQVTSDLSQEVENYRILHEAEVQEHEKTRTRLDLKDRQLNEGRADMGRLAKTIEDLSRINTDLGGKIEKLNSELEEIRENAYKNDQKAKFADELEKNQEELEGKLRNLEEELMKEVKNGEKLTNEKVELERCIMEQHAKVEMTNKSLKSVLHQLESQSVEVNQLKSQLSLAIEALEDIQTQLNSHKTQGEAALNQAYEDNYRLRESVRKFELSSKSKDKDFLRLSADLSAANERILERERGLAEVKKRLGEVQEEAERRGKELQGEVGELKRRLDALRKERNEKEEMLGKSQTEAALVLNRYEEAKIKLQTLQETASTAEVHIRDLKTRYSSLQHDYTETTKTLQTKETQLRTALHRVKALEEELWNRDSENLRKDSQIVKLTQQIDETKKNLASVSAKMRSAIAEKLAEANKLIESKDTEIALLKEMLRSAQLQIKQKENEILHSKKNVKNKEESRSQSKSLLQSVDKEAEIIAKVAKFCSNIEHFLRFFSVKRRKIESMRESEELSPVWLQEELKLPYLPSLDQDPVTLLTESVNQRIEFLRGELAAELERDGSVRLDASAVAEAVGDSLASQLEGYQEVTVRELLEKLRGLSAA